MQYRCESAVVSKLRMLVVSLVSVYGYKSTTYCTRFLFAPCTDTAHKPLHSHHNAFLYTFCSPVDGMLPPLDVSVTCLVYALLNRPASLTWSSGAVCALTILFSGG